MAQPLYFLPDVTPDELAPDGLLDRQTLKDFALDDTFRDVSVIGKECQVVEIPEGEGPDGAAGMLLAYHTHDGRRLRNPWHDESRIWQSFPRGLQIGIDPDNPPTENDLRRRRIVQGTTLAIEGKGTWLIPACRAPDGSTKLPSTLLFTEGEDVRMPVKPEYVAFYRASSEFVAWFFSGDFRDNATNYDIVSLVVFLFGLNYRFGKWEQNLLQLIDTDNLHTIMAYNVSLFDEVKI